MNDTAKESKENFTYTNTYIDTSTYTRIYMYT